jgi:NAD(P)-dependent dehydrogenase (short-subunit alcohol dehydrogenase family)
MTYSVDLRGRNALVTGAGKGIGRAICHELARAGANVFAVSRTAADLESLIDELRPHEVRYGSLVADVSLVDETRLIALAAEAALGPIDILVNNAGVARTSPSLETTEGEWDAVLDTNLKGAFFLAQAVGRGMVERRRGRIINITSQAALGGLIDHAAYCASKAGLGLITKVLAVEWGPHGVTTNAIAPTVILTPMGERVWGDPARGAPMMAKIPLGRFGVPDDVAAVAVFLASDMAAMVNGDTISVDGGYAAH